MLVFRAFGISFFQLFVFIGGDGRIDHPSLRKFGSHWATRDPRVITETLMFSDAWDLRYAPPRMLVSAPVKIFSDFGKVSRQRFRKPWGEAEGNVKGINPLFVLPGIISNFNRKQMSFQGFFDPLK